MTHLHGDGAAVSPRLEFGISRGFGDTRLCVGASRYSLLCVFAFSPCVASDRLHSPDVRSEVLALVFDAGFARVGGGHQSTYRRICISINQLQTDVLYIYLNSKDRDIDGGNRTALGLPET